MKVCGGCGGSQWITLGILGNLKYRRCRLCGLQTAVKVAPRRSIVVRNVARSVNAGKKCADGPESH